MKRAIISVSDKEGIVEFARELKHLGVEIISTGGTAALLQKNGVDVVEASAITKFPECLDGRVKTLHPNIHAGILAIRSCADHMETIHKLGIDPIDLVVINLYPFKATVMNPNSDFDACIENIDIGGPAMLRSAAKNHHDVTVITDPDDYGPVILQLKEKGATSYETRRRLARKVFEHTAAYDTLIAQYLRYQSMEEGYPDLLTMTFEKIQEMRYGENPHQSAAFYANAIPVPGTLPMAKQLNGKELSYNNIADADACIALLKEFTEPTVIAVKHANPCGAGSADTIYQAWRKAYEADTVSIFGGIVAANRQIDEITAGEMAEIFLEVIIAPSYTDAALEKLKTKRNVRILILPDISEGQPVTSNEVKKVAGGILVQQADHDDYDFRAWKPVTEKKPEPEQYKDLVFALKVVKHVKSNAIVLAKDQQTIGIGPGQPNRITSVMIALDQAKQLASGAVMASDAFFPFSDCVDAAAKAGIFSIVQPGGSIRDDDSISKCNQHGISMTFTGIRHFKH